MLVNRSILSLTTVLIAMSSGVNLKAQEMPFQWKKALSQPKEWYASTQATRIAETVLLFQRPSGGWPKNQEYGKPITDADKSRLDTERAWNNSTIDNGATTTEIRFLSRVLAVKPDDKIQASLIRGWDFLLKSQYPNGGWPQYYPDLDGYHKHITFNDDAMTHVLNLFRDVEEAAKEFPYLDAPNREQIKEALARGIDIVLKCQITVKGKKTVWCAQHDSVTLKPAAARSYELPSFSGGESVEIVRFLMRLGRDDPRIVEAIEGAIQWFRENAIKGLRIEKRIDPTLGKGYDMVAVPDPAAPLTWARFYDLETGKPMFCGRDGVVKATLAEIEYERRVGYSWYTNRPAHLIDRDYPKWKARVQQPITYHQPLITNH